jgi:hypothetical protein
VLGSSTVSAACDSSVAGSVCVFVIRNSVGQCYGLADTRTHGRNWVPLDLHVHACVCVCVYIYIYVYICVCVCMCTHTHTHHFVFNV